MPVSVKVGGVWKTATNVYNKVGGVWKTATDMPVKVGGVWKTGVLIQGAYESISTVTLGSTASSITFSSIPSTYQHLQIRFLGYTVNNNNNNGNITMQFNSDTGANYSDHNLNTVDGSTIDAVAGTNRTDMRLGYIRGTTGGSLTPTVNVIDIHDYKSTSKYKSVKAYGGFDTNGSGQKVAINSGSWRSTSAISTITLNVINTGATDSFAAGTVVALYGIKGA